MKKEYEWKKQVVWDARGSPKLNHLAFDDDMIIFCKTEMRTLQIVSSTLEGYEAVPGQKINKGKSALNIHKGVSNGTMVMAEVTTGILRGEFPFNYLGCPIFYMREKKDFFQQLMNKIANKLQGWKRKLLSYGGKAVLIQHVLQSIPIHSLSVMNPPLNVLNTLQKALAQFFWSSRIGEKGRHWVRWQE
ncbi:uncharacterized protein LOC124893343, partial [Capsicum annuum]|uniref:uncharacterized protein LOC124893343 n=1 Tax=Capsicum annuum TaxID=4072 RepID=UPI001FB17B20